MIFCHRWLGLALCVLFAMWFASGIVMMYWGFPEIGAEQRFERAQTLAPGAIHVSPDSAWGDSARPPDSARLTMLDDRPVYRFRAGRERRIVYADSGEPVASVSPDFALRIAAAWLKRPIAGAKLDGTLRDADQWTVSGEYRAQRPLYKFSWPGGDQVYVSAPAAEVVQHTTSASRLAAYFGAIPHWLYWTPLRKNGPLWNRAVVWASGVATVVGLLGLIAGTWSYARSRRIPYRGQKRWHMMLGLPFGALACTWAFSGLLSMEPFEWLSGNNEAAFDVQATLRGGGLNLGTFAARPPREAIEQAGAGIKELELTTFAGQPYYIARMSARESRIVPIQGNPVDRFESARILELVAQSVNIAESRLITRYDAYYLDRHNQHPLPALLIRLNNAAASTLYIDLKTASIVEAYNHRSRWNRWLYHGLHSWNLPWLYRNRPAWDIMVMVFLLGGTSLSVTAVILALELLRRKLRLSRVPTS